MPSDFWAGYISGAVGICVGNPLDVIKVQLQAGHRTSIASSSASSFRTTPDLLKGTYAELCGVLGLMQFPLEQVQPRLSWYMEL
jgi:solute carrier family 25 (mitochondrial carnitine/acylcarnitine transporter), member 20/29